MSQHPELTEPEAPESDSPNAFVIMTKLEAVGTMTPAKLFTVDGKTLEEAVNQISEHCLAFVPDMTVKKDRDAVRSVAATIARTKTFIDDCGKDVLAEAKALTDRVNGQRRWAKEKLQELQDTVRKPLTEFEENEKRLAARKVAVMEQIIGLAEGIEEAPSDEIKVRIEALKAIDLKGLDDIAEKAGMKMTLTRSRLEKALPLALEREAARAKAEEVRRAAEAEEKRLHEKKIADDAAEKARADAEAKAKADADKAKADADAAAAKAKADADAALAAEKARADKEIADAKAKIEADQKAADDARKAQEEADRQRAADEAHRTKILAEVTADLYAALKENAGGETIAQAIAEGKIRHVTISF
jgi:hypothetical protein